MERALLGMQIEDLRRVLIIGNGGSGKTWLAKRIGSGLKVLVTHLDDIRWAPGQYGIRRDDQLVLQEVVAAGVAHNWVIEGVYGWLAKSVLDRVTTLIWLDLPEDECIANIKSRGNQGGGSVESFQELIEWVSEYRHRTSSSSFKGHQYLFNTYGGPKVQLRTRAEISTYAENVDDVIAGTKN